MVNGFPLPLVPRARNVVITGGAGFIGTNLAWRLVRQGATVTVVDNLVRPGAAANLTWLQRNAPASSLRVLEADVRDARRMERAMAHADEIYHLAAQVAVTHSLEQPRLDMEVNLAGTFNVLEGARLCGRRPFVLFTSTNKVYGALSPHAAAVPAGCEESQPLDFHSPYGCSKGAADQYVRDYARVFALRSVVFRMSCIYGPHQHGTEDQGWVAHFAHAALRGSPITIYGDGSQVRDLLYVDDLVTAMELAAQKAERLAGSVFNVGGGPLFARSLLDVLEEVEQLTGLTVRRRYAAWRVGDQRRYVSNCTRLEQATGWRPLVPPSDGIRRLLAWAREGLEAAEVASAPVRLAG